VGALALICTAVWTPKLPHTLVLTPTAFLQVERALLMHSTSYYIKDERPFSDTGGEGACIQRIHGDYMVIFKHFAQQETTGYMLSYFTKKIAL